MNIRIETGNNQPIYEQIIRQVKEHLFRGEMTEGDMLPSIRNLASDLQISVITTKRAYEELEKAGLISSVPGKGFYVNQQDYEILKEGQLVAFEKQMDGLMKEAVKIGISQKEIEAMVKAFYTEE